MKLLKNIRKAPADKINWETSMVERAMQGNMHGVIHHYNVKIETEAGEKELLSITAVSGSDAEDHAMELVTKGFIGLKGRKCVAVEVYDAPDD